MRSAVITMWIIVAGSLIGHSEARAQEAEIVSVEGRGQHRDTPAAEWRAAAVKQVLKAGAFVRTLENSQMALLFTDRTQIRLKQNSQLQLKPAQEAAQFSGAAVRLEAGRAWSQARPQTQPAAAAGAQRASVTMETPAATMSIRGTDWEVEVGPDGRTSLVVLSGVVDIANEQGGVQVASGEGAVAEVGKAPVKLLLVRPRDRVQWVTAYRPQPRRWVRSAAADLSDAVKLIESGEYARALAIVSRRTDLPAALLRADLLLADGEVQAAIDVLSPHASSGTGSPAASALLARALTIADRAAEARVLVTAARSRHPENEELLLAAGDLAVLDGDAVLARQSYAEAARLAPGRMESWLGLGRVELERENVALAKELLDRAQSRAPDAPEPQAELATLAIFANDFEDARARLTRLLENKPDDYVALTARGILLLKTGDPKGALADFLRAGVIEPRFARAWLYSGVAFYQLGDVPRALEAFAKAAELDIRDPLPLIMRSVVHADRLQLGDAIDDAHRARERMPYLKSLNQLLNDQKGSANLGAPLALFGLEEWASRLATDSYSPYWAGSHLFLSDRYIGTFNKNTELFKGFLTDPTVFGASNRHSSLIASPGHYGSIDVGYKRKDVAQANVRLTANGLTVAPIPIAYYLSGDVSRGHSRVDDYSVDGGNVTLGLGLRPNHAFGVFGFATKNRADADIERAGNSLTAGTFGTRNSRADVGLNYKFSATSQVWVKAGAGNDQMRANGALVSAALGPGRLNNLASDTEQQDVQLRHAFDVSESVQIQWGGEFSRQDKPISTVFTFAPARLDLASEHALRAATVWAGARLRPMPEIVAQVEIHGQRTDSRLRQRQMATLTPGPTITASSDISEDPTELNPRAGLQWSLAHTQHLRFVTQHWRRPASVATLAPSDTLGIPVNDRIVTAGGLFRRERLQYDGEFGGKTFVTGYVDRERVRNLFSPTQVITGDFELTDLEALRDRRTLFGAPWDYYERNPAFGDGDIKSAGFALNQLVSKSQSVVLRYIYADGRNTGAVLDGRSLPYIPRHTMNASSQWQLPQRWAFQLGTTWRSSRFEDERNLMPLSAGWNFGGGVHWESEDKRFVLDARLDNLHSDKGSAAARRTALSVLLGYRL